MYFTISKQVFVAVLKVIGDAPNNFHFIKVAKTKQNDGRIKPAYTVIYHFFSQNGSELRDFSLKIRQEMAKKVFEKGSIKGLTSSI